MPESRRKLSRGRTPSASLHREQVLSDQVNFFKSSWRAKRDFWILEHSNEFCKIAWLKCFCAFFVQSGKLFKLISALLQFSRQPLFPKSILAEKQYLLYFSPLISPLPYQRRWSTQLPVWSTLMPLWLQLKPAEQRRSTLTPDRMCILHSDPVDILVCRILLMLIVWFWYLYRDWQLLVSGQIHHAVVQMSIFFLVKIYISLKGFQSSLYWRLQLANRTFFFFLMKQTYFYKAFTISLL